MKIIICNDYAEMSAKAAEIVRDAVSGKKACLGLATGSTPEGMYDLLSSMCKKGECDFSGITTFNLDEYYPISPDDPQSYRYYMNKRFFDKINIDINSTFIPDGLAADPGIECSEYEKKIAERGGIDLQIIGIGPNGHIGFNEPDEELIPLTHVTNLASSTVEANSRFFASPDEVPKQALTMGIKTILSAGRIIVLASGSAKHKALSKMLDGKISTMCPVTMVNLHRNVTLICDKEAYYGR